MRDNLRSGKKAASPAKAELSAEQLQAVLASLDTNLSADGGTFMMNAALSLKNPK